MKLINHSSCPPQHPSFSQAAMNEVYQQDFARHAPAKTTVPVSALALGARVEIEFTVET